MASLAYVSRYLGGKVLLARKILPHLPWGDRYCEPFGGLFSVGLNVPHPHRTVIDLNPRTVNLLRVLRDRPGELIQAISHSDRSQEAIKSCWDSDPDPMEDARRYFWVAEGTFKGAGGRWSSGVTAARASWCLRLDPSLRLWQASSRLQGVDIRHGDGMALGLALDGPRTVFYLDPPYENSVRGSKDRRHSNPTESLTRTQYAFEVDQRAFLAFAVALRGPVVISGYPCPLYDCALSSWGVVDFMAQDTAHNRRRERLWLSPAAVALSSRQIQLAIL